VSRLDEANVRAMLAQHFEHARSDPELAHAMYHDDAVLEFPQSGERFLGVANFREWRSNRPTSSSFEIREVRGRDDLWVAEGAISYDDGPWSFAVTILEFRGDKIARETIYVDEGWEAPEQRARWRAAP
jgi:SnoaL-like protein